MDGPKPFDPASASPADIARVKLLAARLDVIEQRLLAAEAPADFVPELARAWGKGKRQTWRYVARVRRWEWMPLLAMDAAVRRATRGGCVTGDVVSVSGRGSYPVVVLRPRGDAVTP